MPTDYGTPMRRELLRPPVNALERTLQRAGAVFMALYLLVYVSCAPLAL